MINNHKHERQVSNIYIDKSPSDRHSRTIKQNKPAQHNHSTSTIRSELPVFDFNTIASFDSCREQHHHISHSHHEQLISNAHNLLPTASTSQQHISPFILSPPEKHGIKYTDRQVSPVAYETFTDQYDKQIPEQDLSKVDLNQQNLFENVIKLYARYLQWECVALKSEKWMTEQKLLIKERLWKVQNACAETGKSLDGRHILAEWEEKYLLPIQGYVELLETKGLDAKVTESCLVEIKTAIYQLNHFKEKIPERMYNIYMIFLEDCFRYTQDIVNDMVSVSYATLVDSI